VAYRLPLQTKGTSSRRRLILLVKERPSPGSNKYDLETWHDIRDCKYSPSPVSRELLILAFGSQMLFSKICPRNESAYSSRNGARGGMDVATWHTRLKQHLVRCLRSGRTSHCTSSSYQNGLKLVELVIQR